LFLVKGGWTDEILSTKAPVEKMLDNKLLLMFLMQLLSVL